MRWTAAAIVMLAAFAAAPASSQTKSGVLIVASLRDIDPMRLLPPPPAHGSPGEAGELHVLHEIQAIRTPERLARAQWDQDHENPTLYQATLGPAFDMTRLPATAKLLDIVEHDNGVIVTVAKKAFLRMRPWAADPTIRGCEVKPSDDPLSSYPSGHTAVGFSLGITLAYLMPDKAQTILARATDYGYSRMVCGVHYASDVGAGQALSTAVTLQMLHSPELASDIEAARTELKAAGF
jgi:acid phosphatase (class A)